MPARPFKALDHWWWPLAIATAFALFRLLCLALMRDVTLAEDEAQYWEWSRHPAWGYFTKPAGIAWLIGASTTIFTDNEFAVRLPAVISAFIASLAVGQLAFDAFRDRRVAAIATIAWSAVPAFALLAMLMTIDGPLLAAWAVAAWAGHRAIVKRQPRALIPLAIAIAIGVQFKPTMLLIIPGIALYPLLARRIREPAPNPDTCPIRRAVYWPLAILITLAGAVPTILFNIQNDWTQLRHLLDHLGVNDSHTHNTWSWLWTVEYPLIQIAASGAVGILAIIIAEWLTRKPVPENAPGANNHDADLKRSTLWCACLAAPVLTFYFVVTFFARVEANWPITAWVTACPLAAWACVEGYRANDRGFKFGTIAALLILIPLNLALPLAPLFNGRTLAGVTIPTHRLMGFNNVARAVDDARNEVRTATGDEPIVMAIHYGRTAQLAFYLPDHPTVYATARYKTNGEGRQYDIWPHTDLERSEVKHTLHARPAVMIGGTEDFWSRAFDNVQRTTEVPLEPNKPMPIFTARNYRGFDH